MLHKGLFVTLALIISGISGLSPAVQSQPKESQQQSTIIPAVEAPTVAKPVADGQPKTVTIALTVPAVSPPQPLAKTGTQQNTCPRPRIRKEWRELSPAQRTAFVNANKCLRKKPSKLNPSIKSPSVYDDLVYVHWTVNDEAHKGVSILRFDILEICLFTQADLQNQAPFLPWHRQFLVLYESLLYSECAYAEPLPYWDFSMDSQAPEKSQLFKDLGGNGRPSDHCLVEGPLANWTATFPTPHCLSRNFDMTSKYGNMMGAQYTPIQIEYIISKFKTYHEFRLALEEHPHNMIHYGIGGDMFDPPTSANDLIFWIHHSNVDRIWLTWQSRNPSLAYTYGGNRKPNSTVFDALPTDRLNYYGLGPDVIVKDTFSTLAKNYCYTYSKSIMPNVKAPTVVPPVAKPAVPAKPTSPSPPPKQLPVKSTQLPSESNSTVVIKTGVKKSVSVLEENTDSKKQPVPKTSLEKRAETEATSEFHDTLSPGPYDRTDLFHVRQSAPLPSWYLKRHHYSDEAIARVRKREAEMKEFVDKVNSFGWQSNAALGYAQSGFNPAHRSEHSLRHHVMSRIVDQLSPDLSQFISQHENA